MDRERARARLQARFEPLARQLTWVHPNTLTLTAFGVAVLGGAAFALADRWPVLFALGGLCAVLYGLLDALDGAVARLTGRTSRWGDFLDHSLDRLALLIGLGGIACTEHARTVPMLVLMLATLYYSFLGTQLEASLGRRSYAGIGMPEALGLAALWALASLGCALFGLPRRYRIELLQDTVSLTDIFLVLGIALAVVATVQRFCIARRLTRAADAAAAGGGGEPARSAARS